MSVFEALWVPSHSDPIKQRRGMSLYHVVAFCPPKCGMQSLNVGTCKTVAEKSSFLWQAGAAPNEASSLASTPRSDGSIVLAGSTSGVWDTEEIGIRDFAAVALDEDGQELWRYQVRPWTA